MPGSRCRQRLPPTTTRRQWLGRQLLGWGALATIGGCALAVPATRTRMDTLRFPGTGAGAGAGAGAGTGDVIAPTLVVMLPGAFSRPPEFAEAGFPQALQDRRLAVDVLVVDSHLGYFNDRSVLRRLRDEVVLPARAQGYQRIWLLGISLGGFAALGYAVRHGADIDGVLALAPYLGPRRLWQEMEQAGGPRAWRAAGLDAKPAEVREIREASQASEAGDELDRDIWRAFSGPLAASGAPPGLPPIYLGYGLDDRFASAHRRLAELLPPERVRTTPGGHDWPAWRTLWLAWLDQGQLSSASSPSSAIRQITQLIPNRTA